MTILKLGVVLAIAMLLAQTAIANGAPAPSATTVQTLGYSGSASTTDTGDLNSLDGGRFVAGPTGGTATSMSVFLKALDPDGAAIQLGLYTDNAGRPGSLLWHSGTVNPPGTGWFTTSVPSVQIKANAAYWLVFNAHGKNTAGAWSPAPMGNGWYADANFGSWPSTAPKGTLDGQQYAIYLSYVANNVVIPTSPSPVATATATQTARPSATNTPTKVVTSTPTTKPSNTNTPIAIATATQTATPKTNPGSSQQILGFSGVASTVDTGDQNSLDGGRFIMGATNGNVGQMSVYLSRVDSANPGVEFAIYTDSAGKPGTRLWNSGAIQATNTGWLSTPVSNVSLSANSAYWLLFNANGSNAAAAWNNAPMGNGWWANDNYGTWPATAPSGTFDGQQYSMYLSYQPTNSATPTTVPPTSTVVPPTATRTTIPATSTPTRPSPTPTTTQPSATSTPITIITKPTSSGFVSACGTQFCLNGQPFRFVGVNFYGAAGTCGPSSSNLSSAFQTLQSQTGTKVVRFWAFQSMTNGGTDFSKLDAVVAAAKAQGIYLLPTLENHWGDCTVGGTKSPTWYASGYKSNYGYPLSYRDYVGRVVSHYANEPTIFGWMLMNEAEDSDATGLYNFASDMSSYIRSLDPNHMITLGTIGTGQNGTSGSNYVRLYSLPNLNFVEAHDYNNESQALPGGPVSNPNSCSNSIACDVAQAIQVMKKPFIIGEAGITSGSARPSELDAKINAIFQAGGSGYLYWEWTPTGSGGDQYQFGPGDPVNGILYKYH